MARVVSSMVEKKGLPCGLPRVHYSGDGWTVGCSRAHKRVPFRSSGVPPVQG